MSRTQKPKDLPHRPKSGSANAAAKRLRERGDGPRGPDRANQSTLDDLEAKFDQNIDRLDGRLDRLDSRLDAAEADLDLLRDRVETLESEHER